MSNQIIDSVSNLFNQWQRTALALAFLIIGFPSFMVIYLLAERAGAVPNDDALRHAAILSETALLQTRTAAIERGISTLHADFARSNDLSDDIVYYLQLGCVNNAKNEQIREDCLKPRWQRQRITKDPGSP